MAYTNSSLVNCKALSQNHSGQRTHAIDRITPHCVVGQLTAESIGGCFPPGRDASCNYAIGTEGRICLVVPEAYRSWCSSSNANDQRAVTIECASDRIEPYAMNSNVYEKLIALCTDICKRNGKDTLIWFGDKNKTLAYNQKSNEMVLTVHRWFSATACPGNWLYGRLGDVAKRVTAILQGSAGGSSPDSEAPATEDFYRVRKNWEDPKTQIGAYRVFDYAKRACKEGYKVFNSVGKVVYEPGSNNKPQETESFLVRITVSDLRIRRGPGIDYAFTGSYTGPGTFTIVEVKKGLGSGSGWGKLKSGAGWVALDYCTRV